MPTPPSAYAVQLEDEVAATGDGRPLY